MKRKKTSDVLETKGNNLMRSATDSLRTSNEIMQEKKGEETGKMEIIFFLIFK